MFTRTTCIALLLGLMACTSPQQKQINETPEPPKAFQDHSREYALKSSRSGNGLIEELYTELLEKDSSLKALDQQMDQLNQTATDSTEAFTAFNEKNNSYQSAASLHLRKIGDTSLRERIKNLLNNSLSRYEFSIAAHQQLFRQIESNKTSLDDLYTAVKLVSTLQMMEQYRKDNMPSKLPMAGYILKQEKAKKAAEQLIQ